MGPKYGANFIYTRLKQIKNQTFFYLNRDSKLDSTKIKTKFEDKVMNLTLVDVFHHKSNQELF